MKEMKPGQIPHGKGNVQGERSSDWGLVPMW